MIKQAIIVASGLGKRMGELTQHQPKCLLEIDGKPILEYILDDLVRIGVERIIMDVSEKWGQEIERYTQKHYPGQKIRFSYTTSPKGVAYSVYNTQKLVEKNKSALITVSDVICSDGFHAVEKSLLNADLVLGVASHPPIHEKKYTWAFIDKSDRLQLGKPITKQIQAYPLIGVYALKQLDLFFDHLGSTIESVLNGKLSKDDAMVRGIVDAKNEFRLSHVFEFLNRNQYKTVLADLGNCCEINTPDDLIEAGKKSSM